MCTAYILSVGMLHLEEALVEELRSGLGVSSSTATAMANKLKDKVALRLANPPCPICGGSFPQPIKIGEAVQCSFCRSWFKVEDSVEKTIQDELKEYAGISQELTERIKNLFVSNLGSILSTLGKIETVTVETKQIVVENQRILKTMLDKMNVPTEVSQDISGSSTLRVEGDEQSKAILASRMATMEGIIEAIKEDELKTLDPDVLIRVGNIHFANEDYDKALKFFVTARKVDPNNFDAWLGAGNAYLVLNNYELAETMFRKAMEINSSNPKPLIGMANIYRNIELNTALGYLHKALEFAPKDPHVLTSAGVLYLEQTNFQRAKEFFDKILQENPDDLDSLIGLAAVNLKLNNKSVSLNIIERAIKLAPDNVYVLYVAGDIYHQLGNETKALEMCQKALGIRYPEPRAEHLINIATALFKMKDYSKAIEALQKALKKNPENPKIWALLAICHGAYDPKSDETTKAMRKVKQLLQSEANRRQMALIIGQDNVEKISAIVQSLETVSVKTRLEAVSVKIVCPYCESNKAVTFTGTYMQTKEVQCDNPKCVAEWHQGVYRTSILTIEKHDERGLGKNHPTIYNIRCETNSGTEQLVSFKSYEKNIMIKRGDIIILNCGKISKKAKTGWFSSRDEWTGQWETEPSIFQNMTVHTYWKV